MLKTFLIFCCMVLKVLGDPLISSEFGWRGRECYDQFRQPKQCMPEFENAAFQKEMEATNTCGENGDTPYCTQTTPGANNRYRSCDVCKRGDFSPIFLTDLYNKTDSESETRYWQSETMMDGIQGKRVNLTLHLGKAYDITYIQIAFYSPKPHSFAIYKKRCETCDWEPFQYYSATCRDTYGVPESKVAEIGAENRALCTSEYSDIVPLLGGDVPFSTLVGRPSSYKFEKSKQLQEFVTATDLRITLDRLNTFGDEVYRDAQVLKSYWYAIADIAVGARCKCNGHASKCDVEYDEDGKERKFCRCQHNTAGRDCEKCQDFYNDVPWERASESNAHICKPCNCNGFSEICEFDQELYEKTGHGGHCKDCRENRDGANCERCKENYYQRDDNVCIACQCNPTGSRSQQCNREGKCQCKPGVTGDKCDRCEQNHYDFTVQGCKSCDCEIAGSYNNAPSCNAVTGECDCKENVEGRRCRECKPGFFNLDLDNEFGCTPCFCYGHSSECSSASDYARVTLESSFIRSNEKWSAEDAQNNPLNVQFNAQSQSIALAATNDATYFIAPERFLGDQRGAYNHDLVFTLQIGENNSYPSSADVILEGGGGYITTRIFGQKNPMPTSRPTKYVFRLHEHPNYDWTPTLATINFMSILANLTAIKIRATYNRGGTGYLKNFRLETAQRGASGYPAKWVERCTCPQSYIGQFCESCAPGYRHTPALGGPFMPCVLCNCHGHGHASICDSETGQCICKHNTEGDNCELCAKGYYGNAVLGTPDDCQPCPCPNQGPCTQLIDGTIACTECPIGYAGIKCDLCSDGYYGDPTGKFGEPRPCLPCDCNQNVDPNAIGNCDRTTGECLKCIYFTGGPSCDRCLSGYYGNALAQTKGDCKPCMCFEIGTVDSIEGPPQCDGFTGNCLCQPHVTGKNCDRCFDGYFNILTGEGCEACNCNLEGSYNNTCHVSTGQCYCKPGVTGLHCDECLPYHYGFSSEGCQNCDCNESGSTHYQCDKNGQCPCQENVEGRRCDRCKENKQRKDNSLGCVDCPPCYNLVQDAVNKHRRAMEELEELLTTIAKNPTVVENSEFDDQLASVKRELEELSQQAMKASGVDENEKPLAARVSELKNRLDHVHYLLENIGKSVDSTESDLNSAENTIDSAKNIVDQARMELNTALDFLENEGIAALTKAQNRSDQFGQQSSQMSHIAQESRLITEKLENDARNIKDIAESANNTALMANKLAKMGVIKQTNISNELQLLESELNLVKGKLNSVKETAQKALQHSNMVYDQALDMYSKVNPTVIPEINTTTLQNDAVTLIEKAEELNEEIKKLNDDHEAMLDDMEKQMNKGRDLFDQGVKRHNQIQDMLNKLKDIKMRAENAVNQTNNTLQHAVEIHDTLKKFNVEVQQSRQKAQEAAMKIPSIQDSIDKTNAIVDSVSTDLAQASDSASAARDIALQAQNDFAKQASEAAHDLLSKASATRNDAGKLRDEADKLSGRVKETASTVYELEKNANKSADSTNYAKSKVAQATTDAREASKLVKKAMDELNIIIGELKNLPSLDDNELDLLESHLTRAEQELKLSVLGKSIDKLKDAKNSHQRWIKDYEADVNKFTNEVMNVEKILEALPPPGSCFKTTQLET